jgi:hypothetical protein
MATTKKRSSASATISKSSIDNVHSTLKDLPEKPKETLSLREAIGELHESITAALNRGYNYDEVVTILASQGVEITVASLKRYLAAARKEVADKPKRTRRTTTRSRKELFEKQAEALPNAAAPATETIQIAEPMPEPEPEMEAEPAKTPRKRSTSRSQTAAKSAAKSKTAAKAKPTSRAKTTSRSTSSRRKRSSASE